MSFTFPIDLDPVEEVQPQDPIVSPDQPTPVPDVARGVLDPDSVWVVLADGYLPDPASPPVDLTGT